MSALVLLSKPGCHLCDEMKAVVEPLLPEFGLSLEVRDVRDDPDQRARWANEIPVLLWNGIELARHRVTAADLEARLRELPR